MDDFFKYLDNLEKAKEPIHQDHTDDQDTQYQISDSEMEARMKYMNALQELQTKEHEILSLKQRLYQEKARVVQSADIKPTKYNGSADLEDYLKQFMSIARFNSWSKEKQVVVLMSKLEGEALTAAAVLENPSLDELISQLRESFSSERQELASLRLQNRLQKPDESLETLALDVQKLTLKAFPSADDQTKTRLARDSFTNAIADASVRDKLRDKNLASLRESLQEAKRIQANLEIEANRAHTFQMKTSIKTVREDHIADTQTSVNDSQAEIRRLQEEFEKFKFMTARGGKTHCKSKPPPRQTRNIGQSRRVPTCYKCTILGHIAKYCPFSDDQITQWLKDGLIGTPRNRQTGSFPPSAFTNFKPQGNGAGRSAYGQTTPH